MGRIWMLTAAIIAPALLFGCSDGGSQSGGSQEASDSANAQASPDQGKSEAATAALPAADDLSTLDGKKLADFKGDVASGKLLFAQCKACHVTDVGVNKIGPSLAGVIGRQAGSASGFNYSSANKASGFVWTKEKMFQFLEKPQRVIPKTKMMYAGMSDAQKRADIIAYLEQPN